MTNQAKREPSRDPLKEAWALIEDWREFTRTQWMLRRIARQAVFRLEELTDFDAQWPRILELFFRASTQDVAAQLHEELKQSNN